MLAPIMTWNGTLNLKCFAKKESVKLTEGGLDKRVGSDNQTLPRGVDPQLLFLINLNKLHQVFTLNRLPNYGELFFFIWGPLKSGPP